MKLWHRLKARLAAYQAPATSTGAEPARVGLLNTGELIVLSPTIGTLCLTVETTDIIRDVLAAGESSTVHLLSGATR